MKQKEEITLQSLTENEDILIGYSDEDIVVVDSIQKFTEVKTAHVSMNSIAICTNGKMQGKINGENIELHRNQIAVIPQNSLMSDIMVSPDFNLKALFLTTRIMQSFLREKISVWNDMLFIHRNHIITLDDDEIAFHIHHHNMLTFTMVKRTDNPFYTEIIQSLLRAVILTICGTMKQMLHTIDTTPNTRTQKQHFQKFLNLLHSTEVKHRPVEAYARDLCISSKYLSFICKKNSGKTANEWITELVLEDIRYYLKQTDLSIKQICDCLGFTNISFFGRYVKEHFNMTPIELRNSY